MTVNVPLGLERQIDFIKITVTIFPISWLIVIISFLCGLGLYDPDE